MLICRYWQIRSAIIIYLEIVLLMGLFSISEFIAGHGNFMGFRKHTTIWIPLRHCLGVSDHWKHVSSQHCLTSKYRLYDTPGPWKIGLISIWISIGQCFRRYMYIYGSRVHRLVHVYVPKQRASVGTCVRTEAPCIGRYHRLRRRQTITWAKTSESVPIVAKGVRHVCKGTTIDF